MIPSRCPHCGEDIIVRRGDADSTIRCETCGQVVHEPEADTDDRPRSRRRPPPKKKSRVLLIVGLVCGVMFLGCAGVCGLIYFVSIHEIDEPVTEADKKDMLTAEHVVGFVDNV